MANEFNELARVIDSVSKDKGIEKETILEAVNESVVAAAHKLMKTDPSYKDLECQFNEFNEIELFEFKKVVQEVFDEDMEISLSTEVGGVSLLGGYFPDLEALYIEAGFPLGPVDFAIGYGSDGKDAFYAGGDSGIVNLSFGGSKDIKITDDYSLPVFGSFIYNPDADAAFLVFGASF